jgi:hypothetical protein
MQEERSGGREGEDDGETREGKTKERLYDSKCGRRRREREREREHLILC